MPPFSLWKSASMTRQQSLKGQLTKKQTKRQTFKSKSKGLKCVHSKYLKNEITGTSLEFPLSNILHIH